MNRNDGSAWAGIYRNSEDLPISQKQNFIWSLFEKIGTNLFNDIPDVLDDRLNFEDYVAIEGRERTILKLHKFKERDPQIIKQAKEKARKESRFFCEICLFNFEKQYPNLGDNFIECHHKQPIAKGGIRETKTDDLAIVCANCHRMLHRKDQDGNYLTISDLTSLINKKMD